VISILMVLVWSGVFMHGGLTASRVPAVGHSFTNVLGTTVFNFAVITSIPSWVNEKKEGTSILWTMGIAMPMALILFTLTGVFGGMHYVFENNQTMLNLLQDTTNVLTHITFYFFHTRKHRSADHGTHSAAQGWPWLAIQYRAHRQESPRRRAQKVTRTGNIGLGLVRPAAFRPTPALAGSLWCISALPWHQPADYVLMLISATVCRSRRMWARALALRLETGWLLTFEFNQ
jgi:amino acid permease